MSKYAVGLDFGTNSCRALIVNVENGNELASHVFSYPTGEAGVIVDDKNPNLARQNPADYLEGIEVTIRHAISKAKVADQRFDSMDIIGIGVDTTGSSPMPVDEQGDALCFKEEFKNNPAAYVWLWKDHTSYQEAAQITELAAKIRPQFLAKIGGAYSSEWWWSKILHCKNVAPEVYNNAFSWVEICDWIPANLVGNLNPANIRRSICAAGHKAMFNDSWNGLPDKEFLDELSSGLGKLRDRLFPQAYSAEQKIGNLSAEWAEKLGLSTNVAVAVGAFDAHMGAVGAGVKEGTLVKILGTSTCDIMISPKGKNLNDIPGVCGIVDGSVMNNYFGIEAGQSAVGDIFLWFVNNLVPESYGKTQEEKFNNLEKEASKLKPGETGLLALDWNNGNRTILVDVRLGGLLLGQTLYTQPHEIYRALIEATAFGALAIIDRIEEYGVPIKEVVNCGGLASKNPLLMQIYADITNRPMKISKSDQTPALGAAMFSAVAAGKNSGGYNSIEEAQKCMTGTTSVFNPIHENVDVYKKLYKLYKQMHDGFGTKEWNGGMYNVMKELLNIRDEVRRSK
ncbi:MAG: ribulokinase [Stygiobacter sp. RIFOXYC12_FULL_38_8]|nr:MAG: ribulokinase [Stygiobacter sp. GWC2_38_9]OGU82017.1 MAG: ribulokinase [Stygiobacter sp. RIFOXYA12_FULL_38_9]OGV09212.1 MAG: ribulokinase [Stygiobacter sp. RIFOXYB2_FULL_37_11]OGV10630.1 MAG: ribulokinase [Stygiobacter sp. RIFOXYA2_FULL_38_8]OGV13830.1 MAG: ribulokinase [Stygiobacter sp. RIFOXYC2_FULL_38_25]OGV22248.1 MAG: ribulokinase [Stygiobacter sp. RIFOXYC12_FULL_38_8]OGV80214.1 MAG: ribulokinase [Stygiobacter sp. GWF2_38_21]RJQ57730.1 MAG: ribulokinase [Stygiobacter sp.]